MNAKRSIYLLIILDTLLLRPLLHFIQLHLTPFHCRAHWGMGLIFHQAKPRWTRRGGERENNVGGRRKEDSKSSVLDLNLSMRS